MGRPVIHSRSPLIHNHWIAQYGLKGSYVPLQVHIDKLADALRGLSALEIALDQLPTSALVSDVIYISAGDPAAQGRT